MANNPCPKCGAVKWWWRDENCCSMCEGKMPDSNPNFWGTTLVSSEQSERTRQLENKQQSVLQDWVMKLPLREQGTLLTGVRGCDDEPKLWTSQGIAESPGRRLTAFIRYCFMNPADSREIDIPGAFFQSQPPNPFKPSEFGHLPQHWYSHAMHCLEVIAYRHPDMHIAGQALNLYFHMVSNLHLNIETRTEFVERLSEDRIATNSVVS